MDGDILPTSPTREVSQHASRWLGGLSLATRRGYSTDVAQWIAWCVSHGIDARTVTGRDTTQWLADISHLSPATRSRKLAAVNSFYRYLRDEGIVDADPAPPSSRRPRVRGHNAARLKGLDADQAQTLLRVADDSSARLAAIVSLMLTTGLRVSEAASITPNMVTTDSGGRVVLTVTGKGERVRSVVVPPVAVERLAAIAPTNGFEFYFRTSSGKQWTPDEIRDSIARLGRRAGILHLHPHALRHTAGTLSVKGGANIEAVRQMLGHASLNTTQQYVTAAGALDASPAYLLASQVASDDVA